MKVEDPSLGKNPGARPEFMYSLGSYLLYKEASADVTRMLRCLGEKDRYDTLERESMKAEFNVEKSLDHPNILRYLSFESIDSLGDCIETEYFDCYPLSTLLKTGNHLDREHASKVVSQICDALSFIHAKGLIHGNLTPDNILVSRKDWKVKIMGVKGKVTSENSEYSAPEISTGEAVGPQADIFSLGCILFKLCPSYDKLSSKCMKALPSERPQSANEIKDALDKTKNWNFVMFVAFVILAILAMIANGGKKNSIFDRMFPKGSVQVQDSIPAQKTSLITTFTLGEQ